MTAFPTVFVSHGAPDIIISDMPARHYLEHLSDLIGRPKAIVIVSAHFETDGVAVVTDPLPPMIYDFGGFSPELYKMNYPAPGDPALAETVYSMLDGAGLAPRRMAQRGYDHGVWTPLKLAYPNADIAIVQVSIDPSRDARWHHMIGLALSPLRHDGVLLIGSGHITHNLRAIFQVMRHGAKPDPVLAGQVKAFTDWFSDRLAVGDEAALLAWKDEAPYTVENHPTDEHLLPIFFALGAAGPGAHGQRVHDSVTSGFFANDSYLFR